MKHGAITAVATMIGLKPQVVCDYLSGKSGASPMAADRLAAITGTDIRVWLRGGKPEDRISALEAWAESEPWKKGGAPTCFRRRAPSAKSRRPDGRRTW